MGRPSLGSKRFPHANASLWKTSVTGYAKGASATSSSATRAA